MGDTLTRRSHMRTGAGSGAMRLQARDGHPPQKREEAGKTP